MTLNNFGNFVIDTVENDVLINCEWEIYCNNEKNNINSSLNLKCTIKNLTTKKIDGICDCSININGKTKRRLENINYSIQEEKDSILFFESIDLDDSTKPIDISIGFDGDIDGYGSTTATFDTSDFIAPVSINCNIVNLGENYVSISWESDGDINKLYYSITNDYSTDDDKTWNEQSFTFPVKNSILYIADLESDTNYVVKIKAELSKDDENIDTVYGEDVVFKTYKFPYAVATNFKIGDEVTILLTNPLNREVIVKVLGEDGSVINSFETTGTKIKGLNDKQSIENLYKSIPSSKKGNYTFVTQYDIQYQKTDGGTYEVNSFECTPEIGECQYVDNSTTASITQDNSKIIQDRSLVDFYVRNFVAKNFAKIASCNVEINGEKYDLEFNGEENILVLKEQKINSATDVAAKFTLVDSRGFEAEKDITIKMLEYFSPIISIDMQRKENYMSTTTIIVNVAFASLNEKNNITINLRYKKSTDEEYTSSPVQIQNGEPIELVLDNQFEWDIEVQAADIFETVTETYKLEAGGTPPFFFDTKLKSFGLNCFPKNETTIEINGRAVDKKIIATASLVASISAFTPNLFTSLPLTQITQTTAEGFILDDGKIVLDNDSAMISLSALVYFSAIKTNGDREISILKNNESIISFSVYMAINQASLVSIPPLLFKANYGDSFSIAVKTLNSTDVVSKAYITIETVEFSQ